MPGSEAAAVGRVRGSEASEELWLRLGAEWKYGNLDQDGHKFFSDRGGTLPSALEVPVRIKILCVAFLLVTLGAIAANAQSLLVGNLTDNSIKQYDGTTGAFLGNFVAPGSGGLYGATFFIFGLDGNLYVSSGYNSTVKRYNGKTGAYIDDFVPYGSGGVITPYGLAFGRDGNLYVSTGCCGESGNNAVKRYNGQTGAYIDDFVPAGTNPGSLHYPEGLTFGPDGNLYVGDVGNDRVTRYDGKTGAYLGDFVTAGSGGLVNPTSLTFGPDANLYVGAFYGHAIKRYDGRTGAYLGDFVSAGTGGLYWPDDLAFGPDGNLYTTERYSASIKRFSGATGAYIDDFVPSGSGGLSEVIGLLWMSKIEENFYLHGSGALANPSTLFLNNSAPTVATTRYKDSAGINFSGGDPWKEIGTWPAAPALTSGTVSSLSDLHVWLGLKNSDDQGTRFDLRADILKNGTVVASSETDCIQSVTRNPDLAKEVIASFGAISPSTFNGTSDVFSVKVLTRIGTNGSGGFCGGHSNAVGLRLYFDAVSRPAMFDAVF
jgi:hypothetical protein